MTECAVHMHSFQFPLSLHVGVLRQLLAQQDAQTLVFLLLTDGLALEVEVEARLRPKAGTTGLCPIALL